MAGGGGTLAADTLRFRFTFRTGNEVYQPQASAVSARSNRRKRVIQAVTYFRYLFRATCSKAETG